MKLPERTFLKKLNLQRGRCFYCGIGFYGMVKIEIDHIKPFGIYKDGTNKNLCLACVVCNRQKYNMSLVEFKETLRKQDRLTNGLFYFEFIKLKNGHEYEKIYRY